MKHYDSSTILPRSLPHCVEVVWFADIMPFVVKFVHFLLRCEFAVSFARTSSTSLSPTRAISNSRDSWIRWQNTVAVIWPFRYLQICPTELVSFSACIRFLFLDSSSLLFDSNVSRWGSASYLATISTLVLFPDEADSFSYFSDQIQSPNLFASVGIIWFIFVSRIGPHQAKPTETVDEPKIAFLDDNPPVACPTISSGCHGTHSKGWRRQRKIHQWMEWAIAERVQYMLDRTELPYQTKVRVRLPSNVCCMEPPRTRNGESGNENKREKCYNLYVWSFACKRCTWGKCLRK